MQSSLSWLFFAIIFFNLRFSLSTLSEDTEAFITNFSSAFSQGKKTKKKKQLRKLSALKALTVLFYSGIDGARLSLQASSVVPRVFPVKLSSFLLSVHFPAQGLLYWDGTIFFCEDFTFFPCVHLHLSQFI